MARVVCTGNGAVGHVVSPGHEIPTGKRAPNVIKQHRRECWLLAENEFCTPWHVMVVPYRGLPADRKVSKRGVGWFGRLSLWDTTIAVLETTFCKQRKFHPAGSGNHTMQVVESSLCSHHVS